jgi:hypothetical protein
MLPVCRRCEGTRGDAKNDKQSGGDSGEHDCGSCFRYCAVDLCALAAFKIRGAPVGTIKLMSMKLNSNLSTQVGWQ